jgi:quercetin 2,3-dioxygenase
MLDHFTIAEGAGFPDHPHRGQETITYLLSGSVDHEDFAGNAGTIGPGDLQFMTAGRGIVHAEMPGKQATEDGKKAENIGMQLWVDLPKELKFCEPRYRDLKATEIPLAKSDDGKVEIKVISGESLGVESLKDLAYTPVWFLDILIKEGGEVFQKIPLGWNSFAYTLEGETEFNNGEGGKRKVPEYHTVVFGREETGEGVKMSNPVGSGGHARIILVAGMVLDQPVVQYGPFVLNTQDQVYEALRDYQMGANGFERARGWRSEIGKSMA